jgi:hypothetical protein
MLITQRFREVPAGLLSTSRSHGCSTRQSSIAVVRTAANYRPCEHSRSRCENSSLMRRCRSGMELTLPAEGALAGRYLIIELAKEVQVEGGVANLALEARSAHLIEQQLLRYAAEGVEGARSSCSDRSTQTLWRSTFAACATGICDSRLCLHVSTGGIFWRVARGSAYE